jgi:adenosylmethionine-8-amino-7-oxononanoate aminotransferase
MHEQNNTLKAHSDTLVEWDLNYLWHPFTQQKEWTQSRPLFIERGEGSYLIDQDGNRYLDGVSSLWATVHGHSNAHINTAIAGQLNKIAHSTMLGLTHEPGVRLARTLARLAPGDLTRVFYSESGATAVEIALKMAFQYWQNLGGEHARKTDFLCLKNGYHGDTIGAVSVGGLDLFHEIYRPLLFTSYQAPSPHCYRCELGLDIRTCGMACAQELENILAHHSGEIAAMIIEPLVQGAAGILTAPKGYLRRAAAACRRHGVLLIADEVAVGFGRTGRMFACEHEDVAPDLMCLGKGLTGGYLPLAATLTTEEIYRAFLGDYQEYKTFFHGHTYTGNPLACAAALASLKLFESERLLESLPAKIDLLYKGLQSWADHPQVGSIRQCGMMAGVELVMDRAEKTSYPPGSRTGHRVAMACRNYGAIIRPLGDVLVLIPPLTVTLEEIEMLLEAVENAVKEVLG